MANGEINPEQEEQMRNRIENDTLLIPHRVNHRQVTVSHPRGAGGLFLVRVQRSGKRIIGDLHQDDSRPAGQAGKREGSAFLRRLRVERQGPIFQYSFKHFP